MSEPPVAVTGVTGHLGGLVSRALAERGVPQRLLARDPGRAPALPGATVARASFGGPEARAALAGVEARAALAGVEVLFMVSAAESADRLDQHRAFVDAAAAAGVRRVVYTSFLGAAPDATFTLGRDHAATEQHVRARGLDYTFLRDSLYLDFLPLLAGADDVIRGPAGDGRVGAVARADVAAAAAAVLTDLLADPAAHRNQTYDLTGPEALTLAEVAEIVTAVTGRPTRYVPETVAEAYASRAGYGAPDWQLDAWVSTYTAIAAGELAAVTDDVRRLTGRPPIGLRALLTAAGSRTSR